MTENKETETEEKKEVEAVVVPKEVAFWTKLKESAESRRQNALDSIKVEDAFIETCSRKIEEEKNQP